MLAKGRARIGTKVSQSPSHFLLLHASSALSEVLWLWAIVFTYIRPWMLLNSLNFWPSLTTVFWCSQAPQTWQFLKISSLSPYTHHIPNPSHPPTHTNMESAQSHRAKVQTLVLHLCFLPDPIQSGFFRIYVRNVSQSTAPSPIPIAKALGPQARWFSWIVPLVSSNLLFSVLLQTILCSPARVTFSLAEKNLIRKVKLWFGRISNTYW